MSDRDTIPDIDTTPDTEIISDTDTKPAGSDMMAAELYCSLAEGLISKALTLSQDLWPSTQHHRAAIESIHKGLFGYFPSGSCMNKDTAAAEYLLREPFRDGSSITPRGTLTASGVDNPVLPAAGMLQWIKKETSLQALELIFHDNTEKNTLEAPYAVIEWLRGITRDYAFKHGDWAKLSVDRKLSFAKELGQIYKLWELTRPSSVQLRVTDPQFDKPPESLVLSEKPEAFIQPLGNDTYSENEPKMDYIVGENDLFPWDRIRLDPDDLSIEEVVMVAPFDPEERNAPDMLNLNQDGKLHAPFRGVVLDLANRKSIITRKALALCQLTRWDESSIREAKLMAHRWRDLRKWYLKACKPNLKVNRQKALSRVTLADDDKSGIENEESCNTPETVSTSHATRPREPTTATNDDEPMSEALLAALGFSDLPPNAAAGLNAPLQITFAQLPDELPFIPSESLPAVPEVSLTDELPSFEFVDPSDSSKNSKVAQDDEVLLEDSANFSIEPEALKASLKDEFPSTVSAKPISRPATTPAQHYNASSKLPKNDSPESVSSSEKDETRSPTSTLLASSVKSDNSSSMASSISTMFNPMKVNSYFVASSPTNQDGERQESINLEDELLGAGPEPEDDSSTERSKIVPKNEEDSDSDNGGFLTLADELANVEFGTEEGSSENDADSDIEGNGNQPLQGGSDGFAGTLRKPRKGSWDSSMSHHSAVSRNDASQHHQVLKQNILKGSNESDESDADTTADLIKERAGRLKVYLDGLEMSVLAHFEKKEGSHSEERPKPDGEQHPEDAQSITSEESEPMVFFDEKKEDDISEELRNVAGNFSAVPDAPQSPCSWVLWFYHILMGFAMGSAIWILIILVVLYVKTPRDGKNICASHSASGSRVEIGDGAKPTYFYGMQLAAAGRGSSDY
ncbi:uncharacterized protein BCR38DRAFT_489350 [Pseudomassariella vexata]|uniref:Uncharacterized protein n=1 Tax=Pseudomassariella vexata TaxID=1141098 RepID=A0A1Y2DH48_9PEZI|nr:uncharacterized protein BCR38DRAFT_489350 [Pseudomassariella vexata]ORY58424.1 hypothetical protein BCR38DRAFT_489350 [Pseudomassariella vexata]